MKTIKRFPRISRLATAPTSLLLIIFILAIAFPQPALAANPAVTCTDTHIVIRGEWLVKIAGQYGVPWYEIALANNIKSPYTIYPNQKLCIPKLPVTPGDTTPPTSTTNARVSVLRDKDEITITATSFPTKSSFFVRVDDARDLTLFWYKIGVMRTGSTNSATASFQLPDQLKNIASLNVCLKNLENDDNFCNNLSLNRRVSSSGGSTPTGSGFQGTFTARLYPDQVVIQGSGLPLKSFFYVKVGPGSETSQDYKLGILRTGSSSNASGVFELPGKLTNNRDLNVCLKNIVNNTVRCVRVTR